MLVLIFCFIHCSNLYVYHLQFSVYSFYFPFTSDKNLCTKGKDLGWVSRFLVQKLSIPDLNQRGWLVCLLILWFSYFSRTFNFPILLPSFPSPSSLQGKTRSSPKVAPIWYVARVLCTFKSLPFDFSIVNALTESQTVS